MKIWTVALIAFGALILVGCDSKQGSGNAAIDEIVEASDQKQKEMLEQLDSGEGLGMDTEYVGDMADKIDEAAKGLNEADAKLLNEQADALREIQALMKPYEDTLNLFIQDGGLDVSTFASTEAFAPRIEYVNQLVDFNEHIAVEFPPLLSKLGDSPLILAQKLELIAQIRQTDRDLFPSMIRYMEILRDNWDRVGVQPDGNITFGQSVTDEVVADFNVHAQAIQVISTKQVELQRALVMLDE